MTANIDHAAEVVAKWINEAKLRSRRIVHDLAAEGLLMPDLPEPNITNDGWVDWEDGEASFHPTKGLWSLDDGCMVPVSPDRLRDVALIYLAAVKYAEENV